MKKVNILKSKLVKTGAKASAVVGGALASASAFAVDHSDAITAAQADATTNTTAAVTAVITVTAIVTGIGIVVSLLRR